MHMYRVIQTSPLGVESIIALHGTLGQAIEQVVRLHRAPGELSGFRYHVDADPVEVTYMPIEREDTK